MLPPHINIDFNASSITRKHNGGNMHTNLGSRVEADCFSY